MSTQMRASRDRVGAVGWAVAAVVVVVPAACWPTLKDYTLSPKLLGLQLCVAAALAFWVLGARPRLVLPRLGAPACAYLLASGVSLVWALDRTVGLLELTKLLSGFLLFLVVARTAGERSRQAVLRTWVLAAIPLSTLGIAEYLGAPLLRLPSAGLPSATFGYRNIAAMYLVLTLPFSAALFCLATTRIWIWLSTTSAAMGLVFLLYTRTRGAWAGLLGGLIITAGLAIWVRGSSRRLSLPGAGRRLAATTGLVFVFALGALPSGLPKIGPQSVDEKKAGLLTAASSIARHDADRGRFAMWGHTLEMVRAYPILGVGLGNWSVYYPRFDRGDRVTFKAAPERPHNDLLGIPSETGLIGLACYLWLGVAVIGLAIHGLRSNRPEVFWLTCACMCSLGAIAGHSLFSFPRERITPVALSWLALGLLASTAAGASARKAAPASPRSLGLMLLLALSVLQIGFTWRLIRFEHHLYRAAVEERRGDMRRVAVESTAALRLGMFHPEAATLAGYALNQLGEYDTSRRMYQAATAARPNDIQLLNGMGIACQNLGRADEAIRYYERALSVVPNLPDVLFNLAGQLSASGRLDEAAAVYRRVIVHRPDDAQSHFALGLIYEKTGRTGDAVTSYRQFLSHWRGDSRYLRTVRGRIQRLQQKRTE